jgi:hypothetical protein
MNFEVKFALTTLDSRTPSFFVSEIFRSSASSKEEAVAALEVSLETKTATRQLINKLKLY